MRNAVIIMGPPGSGKGTQANLIAEKYGLFHLDTGRFLESLVHNPDLQNDPEVQKERINFDTGKLLDPGFFLKHLTRQVELVAQGGGGIVFSGSPRTTQEAFEGASGHPPLMETLEKVYKKEHINVFLLEVPDQVSMERNSTRVLCSVCKTPILGILKLNLKQCPSCGGELYTRTLDKPEIIKERLEVYRAQTYPVVEGLKQRGFAITEIDATPMPYKIFETISSHIDDSYQK